ncbi:hypothetical protein [Alteromonas sp. 14N.309.X.WAT.G.H12]|uniref:hypothetical protein n=1 Tax=Alteromonas sp. 14N.309.X.WAT.G.H12 TaxID=3120824 RepID=UPI002FD27770
MTKYKKFFSQMAVILAATSAYPTISAEMPVQSPFAPVIEKIELASVSADIQAQISATLADGSVKHASKSLLVMADETASDVEDANKSE